MHTASIANSYGEDHYKFIADTLDKLQEKSNSINGHLSIEGSFLSTFERRWENDNNYNFSKLRLCGLLVAMGILLRWIRCLLDRVILKLGRFTLK